MADSSDWDDTDLVSEWNRMKEEYKKYHSLATQGVRVSADDLVMDFEGDQQDPAIDQSAEPIKPVRETPAAGQQQPLSDSTLGATEVGLDPAVADATNCSSGPVPVPMPEGLDEETKKLVMSWYFAGYYTGRFEGKQQALAEMHAASVR